MSSSQSREDLSPDSAHYSPMLINILDDEDEELQFALRLSLMPQEESDRQFARPIQFPLSSSIAIDSAGGVQAGQAEFPALISFQNNNCKDALMEVSESQQVSTLTESSSSSTRARSLRDKDISSPIFSDGQVSSQTGLSPDTFVGNCEELLANPPLLPPDIAKEQFMLCLFKEFASGNLSSSQSVTGGPLQSFDQSNPESTLPDEPGSGPSDSILQSLSSLMGVFKNRMHESGDNLQIELAAEHFHEGIEHYKHFKDDPLVLTNIDKAIKLFQDAADLTPDDDSAKPTCLTNLGGAYTLRFERLGDLENINMAIQAQQQAVELMPDGHADKPRCLGNLGSSYACRFDHLGDLEDLDTAISVQHQAVTLTPEGCSAKPGRLVNLGGSYTRRFECLGHLKDSDKAIQIRQQAVALMPDGHADKPRCLTNLGGSYTCRFEHLGNLEDIEKAVQVQQQAVALMSDSHADKPRCLGNLGSSYTRRFDHLGDLEDIDIAISVQQQAIALTPDSHASKAGRLTNLGGSYKCRFECLGDLEDINMAIQVQQQAVALTSDGHANRPACLNNLGGSYTHRFENLGDMQDIDKAIEVEQQAVALTPDGHAGKPMYLSNLGSSYTCRFEHIGDLEDINKAIQVKQQAVALMPDGHADMPLCLNNLGGSYTSRFEHLGDLEDISTAIQVQKQAVALTPDGHAGKPERLINLGGLYTRHFERLGDVSDLNKAIEVYRIAATSLSGPPSVKFKSARAWAVLDARKGRFSYPDRLLEPYECLLQLLPELIWLGGHVDKRFNAIRKVVGDAISEAVAAAIEMQSYGLAVEWMEQGRSIIWGQVLHLRSPLDELRVAHPVLASELEQVSHQLESASVRDSQLHDALKGPRLSLELQAQAHRRTAERRERILSEIRSLPGLENFLKPERFAALSQAANDNTVVLINVSNRRCDALVLPSPETGLIVHIPLPDFSVKIANKLFSQLGTATSGRIIRSSGNKELRKPYSVPFEDVKPLKALLQDLWTLVVHPVIQRIEHIVVERSTENITQITWCTTGPLSFLPLHAAGIYGSSDPTKDINISDFVVSSYTPSLRPLLGQKTIQRGPPRILIVTQPHVPGHTSIPGTMEEANLVTDIAAAHDSEFEHLSGNNATPTTVLDGIAHFDWAHLACHGVQHPTDPLRSAFVLADGNLQLSTLMAKLLNNAQLAFLSACQTATGDKTLPEEAVHLTAGMLSAGFQSVVGTMWSIGDQDAPIVAEAFYTHLFKEGTESGWEKRPDSALALHQAVKRLREKVGDMEFERWVPFVHFGL